MSSIPANFDSMAQTARKTAAWSRADLIAGALLFGLTVLPHFPLQLHDETIGTAPGFELYIRVCLCAACCLYGLHRLPYSAAHLNRFPLAWGVLFGIWSVCSLVNAADLRVGIVACMLYWSAFLFVPAAALQLGKQRTLMIFLWACLAYIAGQWTLYLSGSELGFNLEKATTGIVFRLGADSQALAFYAATLVGLLIIRGKHCELSVRVKWLLFAVAVLTMAWAASRTAATVAIVGAGYLLMRHMTPATRRTAVLFVTLAAMVGIIVFSLGLIDLKSDRVAATFARTGTPEEIESVSGRGAVWPAVVDKIAASPTLGCGYGCAGIVLDGLGWSESRALRHAHNEMLNVMLCTGVLGGMLLLFTYVQQFIGLCRRPSDFPDFVLILAAIAGLTEPVLLTPMPSLITVLWFTALVWRDMDVSAGEVPGDHLARSSIS